MVTMSHGPARRAPNRKPNLALAWAWPDLILNIRTCFQTDGLSSSSTTTSTAIIMMMFSLQSVTKWVNMADLAVQLAGTGTYLYAIGAFETSLYAGARALHDDAFRQRLDRGLHSTTWMWLSLIPYLLLLTVVIHKCLFALLARRQSTRLDMFAFVFDSVCAVTTMSWLMYWLATSSLVQVAAHLQDLGLTKATYWLQIWIVAIASMTISMAICVMIDLLYLSKAPIRSELVQDEDELAVPFLTEPVV